jgi:hypothetical protein
VLRSVLPSLSRNGSETAASNGPGEIQSAALADALSDLIEAVGFEVPLVIFLDDWQWVDKESRAVLGKAMRRVRRLACLFLLAERTGEMRLRQEGAEALVQELGGRRIHLGPLDEAELGELLGLLAEFEDPSETSILIGSIHEVTGGNPLFVGEVLRKMADDGIYSLENGRWIVKGGRIGDTLDLPESVQGLIRDRLGRLSPTSSQVAGALARERRSVPVGLLRRRTGLDEAVFTRAMGELVDREVLTWVGPTEVDFSHDQLREAAGLYFPLEGRRPAFGWVRKRPDMAGFIAVTAGAVLFFLGDQIRHSRTELSDLGLEAVQPDYPFGKGRVILRGDSLIEIVPPSWEGGEWTWGPSDIWRPASLNSQTEGPFRGPDNEVRWFGQEALLDEPPRILEFNRDGSSAVYFESMGDDGFQDLAPPGNVSLLMIQDMDAPRYRQNLVRIDEPDRSPRLLYRADESLYGADWSPDGQKVAVVVSGPSDTLAIVSPVGDVLAKFPLGEYRNVTHPKWCDGSRHLILTAYGFRPRIGVLFDTETGEKTEFGNELLAINHPICLGQGRGALFQGGTRDGWRVFFQDFSADSLIPLFPNPSSDLTIPVWLPDESIAPVWEMSIVGGNRRVEWGDTIGLRALGTTSKGASVSVPVTWSTADPGIASVAPGGIVTGNRTGTTFVTATYNGWRRDSIQVSVEEPEVDPVAVLFRETFTEDSLPDWIIPDSTLPAPLVVTRGGGKALSLRGDGQYRDFIQTIETFSLQQGVTLELEFRLPLERDDKERFIVCLKGQDTGGVTNPSRAIYFEKEYCLIFPSLEMAKRQDNLMHVTCGETPYSFEVNGAPFLPSRDWVHLALQIRPDGLSSIFLNREQINVSRYPALPNNFTWKIELAGASVDTELLVRNLTLWRGERFPVKEGEADPVGSASGQEIGGG